MRLLEVQKTSVLTFSQTTLLDPDANWCWNNYVSYRAMQQADNVRNQLKRTMEKLDLYVHLGRLFLEMTFPSLTQDLFVTRSDLISTSFEDKSYYENIQRALTCGFFMQVAHREGEKNGYVTIKDLQVVGLHPSTGLDNNPEWVIYNGAFCQLFLCSSSPRRPQADCAFVTAAEFVLTTRNFVRTVTETRPEW